METLGSLIDKLITVNMKIYHTEDVAHNPNSSIEEVGRAKLKINVLNNQRNALIQEIDELFYEVCAEGKAPPKPIPQFKDYGKKKV